MSIIDFSVSHKGQLSNAKRSTHHMKSNTDSDAIKSSEKMIHGFSFFYRSRGKVPCYCNNSAIKPVAYTPDTYAASAAVSHNLAALTQVDSKRAHSSRLSLTWRTNTREESPEQTPPSVHVSSMSAVEGLQQQTSARWPMITCQIVSSSAADSFPSASKYRF